MWDHLLRNHQHYPGLLQTDRSIGHQSITNKYSGMVPYLFYHEMVDQSTAFSSQQISGTEDWLLTRRVVQYVSSTEKINVTLHYTMCLITLHYTMCLRQSNVAVTFLSLSVSLSLMEFDWVCFNVSLDPVRSNTGTGDWFLLVRSFFGTVEHAGRIPLPTC